MVKEIKVICIIKINTIYKIIYSCRLLNIQLAANNDMIVDL